MKSIAFFLACSCAIMAISCQKNKQTAPVINHETTKVQLKLTGDILVTETPLSNGRKAEDVLSGARNYGNSTLYAVGVRRQDGTSPLYTGLFSNPDSIYIDVPASGLYNVSIHIYKKGTGSGLFYEFESALKYFPFPIGTVLKNRMDSVTRFPYLMDQVAFTELANPLDSSSSIGTREYPEVEYFQRDVNFTGSPNPAPISIEMKRRSFGIRFGATNFTGGELKAEFAFPASPGSPVLQDIKVTPANINSDYHIIGSDDFRTSDSTKLINVKVTWIKPDGSQVSAGTKDIRFKRNVLTKLNLTLSNGTASITPQITETDWSGNETINF